MGHSQLAWWVVDDALGEWCEGIVQVAPVLGPLTIYLGLQGVKHGIPVLGYGVEAAEWFGRVLQSLDVTYGHEPGLIIRRVQNQRVLLHLSGPDGGRGFRWAVPLLADGSVVMAQEIPWGEIHEVVERLKLEPLYERWWDTGDRVSMRTKIWRVPATVIAGAVVV
jgi:hypothetical protein